MFSGDAAGNLPSETYRKGDGELLGHGSPIYTGEYDQTGESEVSNGDVPFGFTSGHVQKLSGDGQFKIFDTRNASERTDDDRAFMHPQLYAETRQECLWDASGSVVATPQGRYQRSDGEQIVTIQNGTTYKSSLLNALGNVEPDKTDDQ